MYEHGKGVQQDYAEALKWFRTSAAVSGTSSATRDASGRLLADVGPSAQ